MAQISRVSMKNEGGERRHNACCDENGLFVVSSSRRMRQPNSIKNEVNLFTMMISLCMNETVLYR